MGAGDINFSPFPNKAILTGPRGYTVDISFGGHHSTMCKSQDKISILISSEYTLVELGDNAKISMRFHFSWKCLNSPLIIFSVGL